VKRLRSWKLSVKTYGDIVVSFVLSIDCTNKLELNSEFLTLDKKQNTFVCYYMYVGLSL
jgi:hypothetical protein